MAAKILLTSESARERLRRLSVVYAVGLRLKIVAELYKREMSATQFYNEFGGGSPSRVAKNFRRLADERWLRYVRSAASASGRGREDFYRATELAFFDDETWAQMPYSMRVASSWNMMNQVVHQLQGAVENSSPRERRDLTCASLLLDELGWTHVIKAVENQFISLFEHQEDARLRTARSGDELFQADVFLVAFEMPRSHSRSAAPALIEMDGEPLTPFPERLAPVLADGACLQIVGELNRREMTARQFYREFHYELEDLSRRSVLRRFEKLRDICWLDIADEQPHRSREERRYRAILPAIRSNCLNPRQPGNGEGRWEAFDRFCAEAETAMRQGTFDVRTDRYVTCSMINLDEPAWKVVISELDALLADVYAEQERAKRRMARTGERPIAMNVTIGAYESPEEVVKAP